MGTFFINQNKHSQFVHTFDDIISFVIIHYREFSSSRFRAAWSPATASRDAASCHGLAGQAQPDAVIAQAAPSTRIGTYVHNAGGADVCTCVRLPLPAHGHARCAVTQGCVGGDWPRPIASHHHHHHHQNDLSHDFMSHSPCAGSWPGIVFLFIIYSITSQRTAWKPN